MTDTFTLSGYAKWWCFGRLVVLNAFDLYFQLMMGLSGHNNPSRARKITITRTSFLIELLDQVVPLQD